MTGHCRSVRLPGGGAFLPLVIGEFSTSVPSNARSPSSSSSAATASSEPSATPARSPTCSRGITKLFAPKRST